jgi:hypothetical protein
MSVAWKVRKTHTKDQLPLVDVVYSVEYFVTSAETGRLFFSGNVELNDPKPEDFIAFDALTDAVLLQWVKSTIGDIMIEDIEKLAQEDDV